MSDLDRLTELVRQWLRTKGPRDPGPMVQSLMRAWRHARNLEEARWVLELLAEVACEDGVTLYPAALEVAKALLADPGQHRWAAYLWDYLGFVAHHAYFYNDASALGQVDDVMADEERAYQDAMAEFLPRAWQDISDPDPQTRAMAASFIAEVRDQAPDPTVALRQAYADERDERVRASFAGAICTYAQCADPTQAEPAMAWLESEIAAGTTFFVEKLSSYADRAGWSESTRRGLTRVREQRQHIYRWDAQQF